MGLHNYFHSNIKKQGKKNIIYLIFIFCGVSTFFLMIFSLGTSFLYSHKYIGKDSDIFLAMGKFAKDGLIPYKEFFDHKGPFIIFVEWLGYLLGNGKPGVFILQVLFLTVTLLGTYKIFRLYYHEKTSLILTISSLLVLQIYFDRGNLTEEYVLPFLMWSTYFAVKFFKGGEKNHPYPYAFLYGMTFIVGAMTRLTNSLPIVLLICIGLVELIKNKQWINILKNGVSFLLGAMVVLVPILIYFIKVDALEEMVYATFIYNFKHGFERTALNRNEVINMVVMGIPLLTALVSGIMNVLSVRSENSENSEKRKESPVVGIMVLILNGTAILFLIISRPYPHYLMIWIPVIVTGIGFIKDWISKRKRFCFIGIALCILVSLGKIGTSGIEIYKTLRSNAIYTFENESKMIVAQIPLEERDKVIVVNINAYFYLITDVTPCYKNFILQGLHTVIDDRERAEFVKDLESLEAKYIVTGTKEGIYSKLIGKHYYLAEETGMLRLYERR